MEKTETSSVSAITVAATTRPTPSIRIEMAPTERDTGPEASTASPTNQSGTQVAASERADSQRAGAADAPSRTLMRPAR